MIDCINFSIFIILIYLSFINNFKNNSIMFLSLIELIWLNCIIILIFLINFFDNSNFFFILLLIFIVASLELSILLLYIYKKK